MGCTNSSLSRQRSRGRNRLEQSKGSQTHTTSLVTQKVYFSQERSRNRVRSWSPEDARVFEEIILETDHGSESQLLHRKEAVDCLSDGGGNVERENEETARHHGSSIPITSPPRIENSRHQVFFPRLHLLESPPKLCPEQERRLRCANLEVPVGLTDLSSDESDDEGDGFEFAKLEATSMSFNSEQGATVATILGCNMCTLDKEVVMIDTPSSDGWERLQGSSISEPELQVLILPSYSDLPSADSDIASLSRVSMSSSQLSPCAPVLENFPSNFIDDSFWQLPVSDDSLYFPGFRTHMPHGFSSGASSFDSLSFRSGTFGDASYDSPLTEEPPPSVEWSPALRDDKWDPPSPSDSPVSAWGRSPLSESSRLDVTYYPGILIPGLPNDLAQICLMRVPFIKYNISYRMVCRQWRAILSAEEFYKTRKALGIQEAHISFVVHGNRVQIFSLHACAWFCLPPLPRGDGNTSPSWTVSPDWVLSPDSHSSPEQAGILDWGIDPYDWWQIDTVAVSQGTLYVIGGDQAELHSFTRPSKPTRRVHKYDFCSNRWIAVSSMQVPRSHAAAVTLGNLIYVAGGSEDIDEGASAEVYNSEQNVWSVIPNMNTSMRMCIGMEHLGCFCVKGESMGPGSLVEGEMFDSQSGKWERMSSGMRRGLERGPIASCNSCLFVADWKDSLLKVYEAVDDTWLVVARLPARISRLVGHANKLYGLTGKIKVDPYNHHVISDAPAEVWKLDLRRGFRHESGVDASFKVGRTSQLQIHSMDVGLDSQSLHSYIWECLWRDSKQMVKTGGLAWVPCIAHCTLFED